MTTREKALQIALTQVGVKEHPAGTNSGPMVNEYLKSAGLGPGFPWCMAFVHWCYEKAGMDLKHPNEASVGFFQQWATQHGFIVGAGEVIRGDIVCYNFTADNWPDHVGIVVSRTGQVIDTVEGNTAIGNDANGGMVMRRTRNVSRCVFARIPGQATPEEEDVNEEDVTKLDAAAKKFIATGVGPGALPPVKRAVFWALVGAYKSDDNAQLTALKKKVAEIKAILA